MPIQLIEALPIHRNSSGETALGQPINLYEFLKYKPIKKRNLKREGEKGEKGESRERLKQQVRALTIRMQEL